MTVTSESSVFILGAGSSAAFELPLGAELLRLVGDAIQNERYSIQVDRNNGHEPGGHLAFWRRPIIKILERSRSFNPARFDELRTLLRDQTSETIDDFIVENPTFASLTKLLVAAILFKKCHDIADERPPIIHNFAPRTTKGGRNWIHLFINVVRQGIRLKEVDQDNKVRVITFNYDTILEQVLDAQFSNTESNYGDWRQYIEVIHVHGQFPPLGRAGERVEDVEAEIIRWAEGIHVVHETRVPDDVKAARDRARALAEDAREIYAAGFAFGASNCKLLGLRSAPRWGGERSLVYCNWNGDIGVQKSAEQIARWPNPRTTIDPGNGTPEKPMEIEAWIRAGFLGETPA